MSSSSASSSDVSCSASTAKFRRIGDFLIGAPIGTGSFSVVYKCRYIGDQDSSGSYAIKVVSKNRLQQLGAKTTFMREVEVLKRIPRSRHLIHPVMILQSARNFYIVMEYASNGTLLRRSKGSQIRVAILRHYVRHLLLGLNALHGENIAHRDIKLENLLLDKRNTLKISDFSFAIDVLQHSEISEICGSPHYVAPEVLEGKPPCVASDIWSAGVCIYALTTGTMPFVAEDTERLFSRIKSGAIKFPSSLECDLVDMLKSMLQVNHEARWSARRLLCHPWLMRDEQNTVSDLIYSSKVLHNMNYNSMYCKLYTTRSPENNGLLLSSKEFRRSASFIDLSLHTNSTSHLNHRTYKKNHVLQGVVYGDQHSQPKSDAWIYLHQIRAFFWHASLKNRFTKNVFRFASLFIVGMALWINALLYLSFGLPWKRLVMAVMHRVRKKESNNKRSMSQSCIF